MRSKFDSELNELHNNIVKMGSLCERAIELAIKCFENDGNEYRKDVKKIEKMIDEYESDIEKKCLKLLLHQQPVAKDLRIISAILKMITDLERIGDQALDIANLSKYTKEINEDLKLMAHETINILKLAIDSFVKSDLELAKEIILKDDIIDNLFLKTRSDIIKLMKSDNESFENALDSLMIAKYIERIADHSVNVCEWVIFSITGLHKGESYDSYSRR